MYRSQATEALVARSAACAQATADAQNILQLVTTVKYLLASLNEPDVLPGTEYLTYLTSLRTSARCAFLIGSLSHLVFFLVFCCWSIVSSSVHIFYILQEHS